MKKPRQSRLSQTTRIKHLEEENKNYQDFVDDLMTLLEDYNFLEPEEEELDEVSKAQGLVTLEVVNSPSQQDESQHPEDDNPSNEPDV